MLTTKATRQTFPVSVPGSRPQTGTQATRVTHGQARISGSRAQNGADGPYSLVGTDATSCFNVAKTHKKEEEKQKKRILTCSDMRSSSRKFKRRICGSGYCTGKHDCNLPNNRSKLGGNSYCTGQRTQKHGDFHHESLHTEHDQRKHDQLRRQDTIFFFYGAAAARFCTCSRSSLPPPARARLPPSPTQPATHSHASGSVCPCWHTNMRDHHCSSMVPELRFGLHRCPATQFWF